MSRRLHRVSCVRVARHARTVLLLVASAGASACVTSPKAEAARQQQMIEMGDAINDLRIAASELTSGLDSLKLVIARQDTTIARLANVTGVIVVK